MDSNYKLLTQREIIDIFIEGDRKNKDVPLPYLTGEYIKSIGIKFGITLQTKSQMEPSRWKIMQEIIKGVIECNKISQLLQYIMRPEQFKDYIKSNYDWKVLESNNIQEINLQLKNKCINLINEQLKYSSKKLVDNEGCFEIYDIEDMPLVRDKDIHIDITYVSELLKKAQDDLLDNDFESVLTKARTILEETFIYILRKNGVKYKNKGNINDMYNQVTKVLGMTVEQDWNPRVKEFISRLNMLVRSFAEIRNKDSDAHGSADRIKIKSAEAELIINSSANIAIYFLRVCKRQDG